MARGAPKDTPEDLAVDAVARGRSKKLVPEDSSTYLLFFQRAMTADARCVRVMYLCNRQHVPDARCICVV